MELHLHMHTTNHLIYRRSTTIALTAESHRCMPRIRALVPSAASHATLTYLSGNSTGLSNTYRNHHGLYSYITLDLNDVPFFA
jgi:hypothetical protein